MLNPNNRNVYTKELCPPPNWKLDQALATTFSLDPVWMLGIVLCLAGLDTRAKIGKLGKSAVWDKLDEYQDRIRVFVQAGRIQPSPTSSCLFSLLENIVVERSAPGGGSFHPKIWVLRFQRLDDATKFAYRLLVLSQNISLSPAWDVYLRLDDNQLNENKKSSKNSKNSHENEKFNDSLCDFLKKVVNLDTNAQWETFIEGIRNVDWELPDCKEMNFYHHGYDKDRSWKIESIPENSRLLVVSPFCTPWAIDELGKRASAKPVLVSMPMELDKLYDTKSGKEALQPFSVKIIQDSHMDAFVEPDDVSLPSSDEKPTPQDADERPFDPHGLHAKIYIYEDDKTEKTHLLIGSANATNAALQPQENENGVTANIEILVELVFKNKKGESLINQQLETDNKKGNGFGQLLIGYKHEPKERTETEKEIERVKESLDKARNHIVANSKKFRLRCEKVQEKEKWNLIFFIDKTSDESPVKSWTDIYDNNKDIEKINLWPITVPFRRTSFTTEPVINLGTFDAKSLTCWLAFELVSQTKDKNDNPLTLSFVLKLSIDELPEEKRRDEIIQEMIPDWDTFRQYIALLFDEPYYCDEKAQAEEDEEYTGKNPLAERWLRDLDEYPILENLVTLFSNEPNLLKGRIERLEAVVASLQKKSSLDEKQNKNRNKKLEELTELCRAFQGALKANAEQ